MPCFGLIIIIKKPKTYKVIFGFQTITNTSQNAFPQTPIGPLRFRRFATNTDPPTLFALASPLGGEVMWHLQKRDIHWFKNMENTPAWLEVKFTCHC